MTTTQLEHAIRGNGLRASCRPLDAHTGEVPIDLSDADGRNVVSIQFFYRALDDNGLVDYIISMYFRELDRRRAARIQKEGKK